MPRITSTEFESLGLEPTRFVDGFELHDVWLVEFASRDTRTVPGLRALLTLEHTRRVNPVVRGLFALRSGLGRLFRWDPEGAWVTLHQQDDHGIYQVVNATVNAILFVVLVRSDDLYRFFWATYLKPVRRITAIYMGIIDPFRRAIVYPGLESWMKRTLAESKGDR